MATNSTTEKPFALLMKTVPKLTQGIDVFRSSTMTAVYTTMYVHDHQRPTFRKPLWFDPYWYALEAFTKSSKRTEHIHPITLEFEHLVLVLKYQWKQCAIPRAVA